MNIVELFNEYWEYLTIPVVSAIVGYGTNWLAVKMMMGPIGFRGIGPFGWEGVIPANSEKMARLVVEHSVKKVLTQEELISRINPKDMVDALNHRLEPFVEEIVDEVMLQTSNYGLPIGNFLWSASPGWLKDKVYEEVKTKFPEAVERAVADIRDSLTDVLDINELIVEKLGGNKQMIIDVFKKSGEQEFKFIERSGLYFGLPLGIPVMFIWYFFPVWWVLPLFGLLVGYITNALALYLIQKPLNPVKVGPFVIQGLFIKRQKEVSRYYGQLFANELITAEVLAKEVLGSESAIKRIHDMIYKEVSSAVESMQGSFKPLTVMSMGVKEYTKINKIISEKAFQEVQMPDKRSFQYLDEAFDIEETVADRVGNLPPEEFFELLHPVIEEDEWKLIAVGAVLGLGAGFWQWALLT
jgi:uncharacterized membrane protein YheB (UPF0754 family)